MSLKRLTSKFELNTQQQLVVIAALLIMAATALTVVKLVERNFQSYLHNELQTILQGMTRSIQVWGREQRLVVQTIAQDEHVLKITRGLLLRPREQLALLAASEQKEMRLEMRSYLESKFYEGYFIIAPDNTSLASSRDTNVGTPNLLTRYPELLAKVWNGETRLTPIQRSDVPLKRGEQDVAPGNETMFVAAPIKDNNGNIIAILALRINPYLTLFPIMENARIGNTGDSYAFDHNGTLLSRTRHEKVLVRMGILQEGQSSASNLRLFDPGSDLTEVDGISPIQNKLPLTKMAASAIRDEAGIDLNGYRDFRGVPVVGIWKWDDELGFGFAIEQEVSEAYSVFYFMRFTTFGGAVIAASILIVLVIVFATGKRQIASVKKRLQSIVETATDGIVVIDDRGSIESINPAMEKIFGRNAEQLIGNNVSVLMPEPYCTLHDGYISHYLQTGETNVIGIGREVEALRSNGETFPIELSVNRLELDSGLRFAGVIRDISARKQAELELKQEKEAAENANLMLSMTQQALDRTGIGEFWIASKDGRVLLVNDHACRHLGYSREELLQLRVPDFDSNFTDEEFPRLMAPILERGWGRFETIHRTKTGTEIPVEVIVVYLPNPPSGEPMSIAFSIDISERKKSEQAIIQAREEAEAANHAKSTFLATMSHEIRTPLYGVVGTVDMLAHTKLDSGQQDLINTAKDSAVLLQGIIDDILDFSKIEAGKLELERVPLTLEPLVEKLGDNLQHLANMRKVELLIYCDPRLPEVRGDPVRLRQILYNLTGNAIKFSSGLTGRNGRVIVSALLKNQEDDHVDICLRISDNGIGMNTEVQKRLFQPFVQGEEVTTRRYGGTGLGLVITERLVDMMGGHIDVESTEGEGSIFSVHLSLEMEDESEQTLVSNLGGLKVLLIKDDDNLAWVLTRYLEHAGADVLSVSPEEAISCCRKACEKIKEPVIVIDTEGDIDMARSLREQLRNSLQGIELRFVLVERGRRRYARQDEGDGLTLDLNAMHRATLLNAVAAVAGRESPIQEQNTLLDVVPNHTISVDEAKESGRLILLVDDNETNRKLISQQLQMIGFLADAARDGAEALEMWRTGDYAMLMTDCHMPIMDGYQLSKQIRQEETKGEHAPIVAITADAMKGTAQKCFAAGMDDYLTKPIELYQLREAMGRWLPDRVQEDPAQQVANVPESNSDEEVVDSQALGRLLDTQDREILSEYYSDFIAASIPTVEQIRSAFHQDDLPAVGSLAHKLKSSARTVGADTLADCCLELETAGKEGNTQVVNQHMLQFFRLFDQVQEWIEQYCKTN